MRDRIADWLLLAALAVLALWIGAGLGFVALLLR
jgi:hypothetical protein